MRPTRRRFLHCAAACAAAAALPKRGALATAGREAFDARSIREALDTAGYANAIAAAGIRVEAPELVDNPAVVPIAIESTLPGTHAIALLIDRNPFPYIARFDFHVGAASFVGLRARIAESSPLRAIAVSAGGHFLATRTVQTAGGGCGTEEAQAPIYPEPAPPIKMRARSDGAGAELRVLMTHPMENGLRKTATGTSIPERFIQSCVVRLNGEPVISAMLGRSMSQDPLLALRLARAVPGDRLAVSWRDSAGATRTDEVHVG